MIYVNKALLIIACLFMIACEIRPSHVITGKATVTYDTSYCGYEPYDVTPYHISPWACYDSHGLEYCEWVFAGHYSECMETWYYDWDWCEWVLFDETCYAI